MYPRADQRRPGQGTAEPGRAGRGAGRGAGRVESVSSGRAGLGQASSEDLGVLPLLGLGVGARAGTRATVFARDAGAPRGGP